MTTTRAITVIEAQIAWNSCQDFAVYRSMATREKQSDDKSSHSKAKPPGLVPRRLVFG